MPCPYFSPVPPSPRTSPFFFKKIILFLAALGLCCCVWAFCSCGERGLLFVAARKLLVMEHGL